MYRFWFTACSVAWFLLTGLVSPSRAAYVLPPEVEKATPEQQRRFLQETSERSLRDQIEVGKERYAERQAFRGQLVTGMKVSVQQRREEVAGQAANQSVISTEQPGYQITLFLLAAVLGVAFLASRRRHSRQKQTR